MFFKHMMNCMFRWVGVVALLGVLTSGVQAQQVNASDKTIKLVVPFPAGGPTDRPHASWGNVWQSDSNKRWWLKTEQVLQAQLQPHKWPKAHRTATP